MKDETPLDAAFGAMQASAAPEQAAMGYYDRLGDTEFFLALEAEAQGEVFHPVLFPFEGTELALAFDTADRLAAFFDGPAPYLIMSGKTLCAMLAEHRFGLAINPDVAPSANVLGADVVAWLVRQHNVGAAEAEADLKAVYPPTAAPEALIQAIDAKLAAALGLASHAILVQQTKTLGPPLLMLAICDAVPHAKEALTQAIAEVVNFSGIEGLTIDVVFTRRVSEIAARFAKVGLRFDLPQPDAGPMAPPGSDPDTPPILR